jgi:6-phosphofructokinase 1
MLNLSNKKILVFTGGGVAPALNPTLYGVITAARKEGAYVLGGLYGWASLLKNGKIINLNNLKIDSLQDAGGTFLRSSRTNPLSLADGLEQVKEKIKELNIDSIVAIGGNDTLTAAYKLAKAGLPIVSVPKTIDNDLSETYFTPGFPSAANYLANFTREIKEDAAYALSRIFIIEAMGMEAGWLSLSSIYGHADVILPPEWQFNFNNVLKTISERYEKNGNYAVVVIAQEAHFDEAIEARAENQIGEQYGHVRKSFICLSLKDRIKKELGIDTKALYPGNFLETGKSSPLDRDLAIKLGRKAIELIKKEQYGFMANIIRPNNQTTTLKINSISLDKVIGEENYRRLPENYFDREKFLPTKKFLDYMEPILGKYKPKEDEYTKLIKKIKG